MLKKILPPIIITFIIILYFILYFGIFIYLVPGIWKYILVIFPSIFSIFMIFVCVERLKEIKEGEDDDFSKY